MGLLYTEGERVLLDPRETRVSHKGNRAIGLRIFHGKLDVKVNGIDVFQELITVVSLLDVKSVIHIPKPKP